MTSDCMRYLPVFLKLDGEPCLVIGGGQGAERRVRALLEAEARVTVVSPQLTPGLTAMSDEGAINHIRRRYQPGDVGDAVLVYVAVNDRELGAGVAAEARRRTIQVNVTDAPELCSFIAPSVMRRGGLQIAVSTSGASPALARTIREKLEARFGPEYNLALEILRAARRLLRECDPDPRSRALKLGGLAESGLVDSLARGDRANAERIVAEHIGVGLLELGVDPALFDFERGAADHPPR
jgi:precorrin-2 dehydrogenase/sirohydrochlorin ferrochelatase